MTRALLPGIAAALGFGTSLGTLWLNPGLTLFLAGFSLVLGAFQRLVPLLWLSAFFLGAALPQSRAPSERLLRRGIHGLFWAREVMILSSETQGILLFATTVREKLHLLFSTLPEKSQALLNAIFWEAGAFFRRGLVHFGGFSAFPKSGAISFSFPWWAFMSLSEACGCHFCAPA